jgi:hypothetical protein
MQWDQVIQTLLNTLLASVGVIVSAIFSGWVLLRVHHSKVKDELAITAGAEQLKRKQLAYEQVWEQINKAYDYTQGLVDDINWRRTRAAQTALLLAGSEEVIGLYFKIQRTMEREEKTAEGMTEQAKELTDMLKDLWNAMRKDLYGASTLAPENIRFYAPGRKTLTGIQVLNKHRAVLERQGLVSLRDYREMNVDLLSSQLGVPRNELEEIRSMAKRELNLMGELEEAN